VNNNKPRTGWRGMLAAVPAVGLSLLPNVTCPACWPAYAGLLSSLGVPILLNNTVMIPITVLCMSVAVGSMAYRAKRRKGYGPFAVGVVAATIVIVAKFVFVADSLAYAGIALLVAASFWNSRPKRRQATVSQSAMTNQNELVQIQLSDSSVNTSP
jgi:mercuric ion transport protein